MNETAPWVRRLLGGSLWFLPLTLVLFVGFDFVLRHDAARRMAAGEFREPLDSAALIDDHLAYFNRRPGPKVAFLGESSVQGHLAKGERNALPSFVHRLLAAEHDPRLLVANFGVSGATGADLFFIGARVDPTATLIVCPVNYVFFSHCFGPELRFPALRTGYESLVTPELAAHLPQGAASRPKTHALAGVDARLSAWTRAHWFFLRYRPDLNYRSFGAEPHRRVRQLWLFLLEKGPSVVWRSVRRGQANRLTWAERQAAPHDQMEWRRCYHVGDPIAKNADLLFLRALAALAQQRRIPLLFYVPPINFTMAERYAFFRPETIDRHLTEVEAILTSTGARWADFRAAVPSDYFNDMTHLNEQGNALFARGLADAVKQRLETK
jgi:lysophospholipase L1-like esterase